MTLRETVTGVQRRKDALDIAREAAFGKGERGRFWFSSPSMATTAARGRGQPTRTTSILPARSGNSASRPSTVTQSLQ